MTVEAPQEGPLRLRTCGELALICFTRFGNIREHASAGRISIVDSVPFVAANFALAGKFPESARTQFLDRLPFSDLERLALRMGTVATNRTVRELVGARLRDWVNDLTYTTDRRVIPCSEYLQHLYVHHDRYEDRQATLRMAHEMMLHSRR